VPCVHPADHLRLFRCSRRASEPATSPTATGSAPPGIPAHCHVCCLPPWPCDVRGEMLHPFQDPPADSPPFQGCSLGRPRQHFHEVTSPLRRQLQRQLATQARSGSQPRPTATRPAGRRLEARLPGFRSASPPPGPSPPPRLSAPHRGWQCHAFARMRSLRHRVPRPPTKARSSARSPADAGLLRICESAAR
jgi:hypothetical protein